MARDRKRCAVDGCDEPQVKRGWCSTHYRRWYRHGDPGGAELLIVRGGGQCTAAGCDKDATKGGMCAPHYRRYKRHGDPLAGYNVRNPGALCAVPNCAFPVAANRLCNGHYQRLSSPRGLRPEVPLTHCTICRHPEREQIEDQYLAGISPAIIANRFGIERHSPATHMKADHLARDLKRTLAQIAALNGEHRKRARDRQDAA